MLFVLGEFLQTTISFIFFLAVAWAAVLAGKAFKDYKKANK